MWRESQWDFSLSVFIHLDGKIVSWVLFWVKTDWIQWVATIKNYFHLRINSAEYLRESIIPCAGSRSILSWMGSLIVSIQSNKHRCLFVPDPVREAMWVCEKRVCIFCCLLFKYEKMFAAHLTGDTKHRNFFIDSRSENEQLCLPLVPKQGLGKRHWQKA